MYLISHQIQFIYFMYIMIKNIIKLFIHTHFIDINLKIF